MAITQLAIDEHTSWINMDAGVVEAAPELVDLYDLDEEIIEYALDKNERARVEYDRERRTLVVIYHVPHRLKREHHYETLPMTFILQPNRLLTITNEHNAYVVQQMMRDLEMYPGMTMFEFLFSTLFEISDSYFPLVEEINKERDLINKKLRQKTTRENLLALSDLETGMVYFVAAAKQNAVLLEQLKALPIYRLLSEDEKEQLDDSLIEARQLVEMTQLTSQILQQLSGAYNNVLNNNLNDTMKLLTVISILLTIPTIVTGFWGMNVPLPFAENPYGWLIIIVVCAIGWFITRVILDKLLAKE